MTHQRRQGPRASRDGASRQAAADAKAEKRASARERRERVEFFESAHAHTPAIEVRLDGASFLVPTDDVMGRTLFLKRRRREFDE